MCVLDNLANFDQTFVTIIPETAFCTDCLSPLPQVEVNATFEEHVTYKGVAFDKIKLETPINCEYCGKEIPHIGFLCVEIPMEEFAEKLTIDVEV